MNIVILTGAGISAESGIQTFRASDGLWEEHRIEDVATPEGFHKDPKLVHQFYNARRAQLKHSDIKPNQAHLALAELAQLKHVKVTLVTQNVDNLHERGGSEDVIHMHGELIKAFCHFCGHLFETTNNLTFDQTCQHCKRKFGIRPDIVWFGEMPKFMQQIESALYQADIFVAIGTSGQVYPAAGFVDLANQFGAKTVEINLEPSGSNHLFQQSYIGPASEQVPLFVDDIKRQIN
ncbi:NAD-dependent protein deacylase [Catenovulum sp. SM1970]|uniref:Sir2 family NAD+-dependent deacetylase n=1 Tax=Marinifaba aquimaris TaxID=2741323 RepID=UPI001571800C|nr:Sir2 family NAD+-dependent deacetylase [Marinifaba aquimaris]NTS76002.1 NAD-dependent protein deacylase [Marinifaba aquimaris]